MKLEKLTIRAAASYDKFKGYRGEITFDGPRGKVQIQTGDALSRRILKECAGELIAAAEQVARELTADIVDHVPAPAIEDQSA